MISERRDRERVNPGQKRLMVAAECELRTMFIFDDPNFIWD